MFTAQFIPGATPEQAAFFNELQRRTTSPECAACYLETTGNLDVTELLGKVITLALVMHARGDASQRLIPHRRGGDTVPLRRVGGPCGWVFSLAFSSVGDP